MDLTLIKKYFANECSEQEVKTVLRWINSPEGKKQINQLIDDYDSESNSKEIDSENLLNNIHERIAIDDLLKLLGPSSPSQFHENQKHERKYSGSRKLNVIYRTAAVIAIFLISAVGIYYVVETQNTTEAVATQEKIIKKSTERGQKLTIHLNDGSKVILNAASQIIYAERFPDSVRTVEVEGEAYFEVAKDPTRPFIVKTGNVRTQALGTAFNVFYRKEINKNNISLVNGKVKVFFGNDKDNKAVILNPGERANLNYPNKTLEKDKFDQELITSWKDGIIYFKDSGFSEVINTLENWYGVDISWNGKPKDDWKFSAKFEDESLKNILDALKYAQDLDYTLHDENVTINFK